MGNDLLIQFRQPSLDSDFIPSQFFFPHKILTCDHEVREIYYGIGCRIHKENSIFLLLLLLTILVSTFPVETPQTISIIARITPLVLVIFMVCGRYFQILCIRDNGIHGISLWKFTCWTHVWISTKTIYILLTTPLETSVIVTIFTSHIWPGRQPSTGSITIPTEAAKKTFFKYVLLTDKLPHFKILVSKGGIETSPLMKQAPTD